MSQNDYADWIKSIWQGQMDFNQLIVNAEALSQKPELAAVLYQTWLARYPSAPHTFVAWFNLGVTLYQTGDIAGARAAYESALRLNPQFAHGRFNLGVILEEQGEQDAALEQWEAIRTAANTDDPNQRNVLVRALNRIGNLQAQRGQFEAAAQAFANSLALLPHQEDVIQQLAGLRHRQHQQQQASALAQAPTPAIAPTVHNLPPAGSPVANLVRDAEQYEARGDVQGAIQLYRRWLRQSVSPDDWVASFNLGILLRDSGDLEGAREALRATWRQKPDFEPAKIILASIPPDA